MPEFEIPLKVIKEVTLYQRVEADTLEDAIEAALDIDREECEELLEGSDDVRVELDEDQEVEELEY